MHHRSLFAQIETRCRGQHETDRFDDERPLAKVAANDKATEDAFDLQSGRFIVRKCLNTRTSGMPEPHA